MTIRSGVPCSTSNPPSGIVASTGTGAGRRRHSSQNNSWIAARSAQTAAGRQAGRNTQAAVAAVSTMGYAGSLAGPALIGLVARLSSLPLAITAVAIWLALAVTLGLRSVRHAA